MNYNNSVMDIMLNEVLFAYFFDSLFGALFWLIVCIAARHSLHLFCKALVIIYQPLVEIELVPFLIINLQVNIEVIIDLRFVK